MKMAAGSLKRRDNLKLFKIFCYFLDPKGSPKVRKFKDKVHVIVYACFRGKLVYEKRRNKAKVRCVLSAF
jgi:hypothetical protein